MPEQRVQFNGNDLNFPTLGRNDYTPEEQAATWISSNELTLIKEGIKSTLLLLHLKGDRQGRSWSINHTRRGLESLIPEIAASKQRSRFVSKQVVFYEQFQQFRLGIHDPERLSQKYIAATESSRNKAILMGLLDAEYEQRNHGLLDLSLKHKARSEPFKKDIRSKICNLVN
mmetsp:Transcript_10385/g.24739  ORF Transcript_10385/g.24739 Transcript_10385/m.24739 type:complete len:172 (-) Transcript_10385:1170-1685(-)